MPATKNLNDVVDAVKQLESKVEETRAEAKSRVVVIQDWFSKYFSWIGWILAIISGAILLVLFNKQSDKPVTKVPPKTLDSGTDSKIKELQQTGNAISSAASKLKAGQPTHNSLKESDEALAKALREAKK